MVTVRIRYLDEMILLRNMKNYILRKPMASAFRTMRKGMLSGYEVICKMA